MDPVNWLVIGVSAVLTIASSLYAYLSLVLLIECLIALFPRQPEHRQGEGSVPAFAVLMPAHNEADVLANTLASLLPEVDAPTQIHVVADNCQDATANIARASGVTVLERTDVDRRGKGYALDYGLKFLADAQPEIVVMVDADCQVAPGTLRHIVQASQQTNQPVQAVYRMAQPPEPSLRDRLSSFAFIVKNRVRAGGLSRLGVPIMLGGTGMAFPWQALQSVELASGHIVEDMKLGIDLAIAGYSPSLAVDAEVVGILPADEAAATSQRTRWEHGHLQVLTTYVPKLLGQAVRQLRPDLFVLALDLAIPPLALWTIVGIALTIATGLWALVSSVLALQVQVIADVLLVSAVLLAWLRWGRQELSFGQLLAVPSYILWKIPLYLKAIVNPEKDWIRTKRNS